MNATKRKFNALLQGIGSRPTSSTASDNNNKPTATTVSSSSFDSPRRITTTDSTNTTPAAGLSRLSDSGSNMRSAQQPARPPSNSSVADQLDFLSKRRRIGQPASTPSASSTTASTATRISNVVLRKWSGKDGGSANVPPPRYCPGDREQLIKRLATFQELTDWTPKPDRINEIEWAKNGWVCQGKERLRCTLCSKEVVVKLTKKDADGKETSVLSSSSSEVEEALVDKYVEMMVSSHQEDCLWRKKGCDDTLLRLPLAKPRIAQEGLRQRYDELCARKDFLPYEFNLKLPEGFDLDAVLSNLPPDFFAEPPPPSTTTTGTHPNRPALALAALGWQGLANPKIGPVPNSASCHSCLRRLGLWMFKSKEVDPDTGAVLAPALMDHLDPVREHRPFCPWRNGAVQRNPGSGAKSSARARAAEAAKPAWEVLAQVLRNDAYLRNRTSTATTRRRTTATTTAMGAPTAGTTDTTQGDQLQPPATPTSTSTRDYGDDFVVEDEAVRAAKDKERWARLRKVKSLFNTKAGRKLGRSASRPGTGHSTLQQPEGGGST